MRTFRGVATGCLTGSFYLSLYIYVYVCVCVCVGVCMWVHAVIFNAHFVLPTLYFLDMSGSWNILCLCTTGTLMRSVGSLYIAVTFLS